MGQYAVALIGGPSPMRSEVEQPQSLVDRVEEDLAVLAQPEPRPTTPAREVPPPPDPVPDPPPAAEVQPQAARLYRVQAGAFSSRANAEALVLDLKAKGYEAIISSGPPYRVQLGAFSNIDNARTYAEELRGAGFEVTIIQP